MSILDTFDKHERKEANFPGFTRKQNSSSIVMIDYKQEYNMISYSTMDNSNLDKEVETQLDYFKGKTKKLEWKVYTHDKILNLHLKLKDKGFELGEEESVMCLSLDSIELPSTIPSGIDIRKITNPEDVPKVFQIQEEVFDPDQKRMTESTISELNEYKKTGIETTSLFAVYVGGIPVSSARICYNIDSPFAGLWSGGTKKEFRGKGFYSALVNARISEALGKGVKYITIDALPTSRPIVEKLGFKYLTSTIPCIWTY